MIQLKYTTSPTASSRVTLQSNVLRSITTSTQLSLATWKNQSLSESSILLRPSTMKMALVCLHAFLSEDHLLHMKESPNKSHMLIPSSPRDRLNPIQIQGRHPRRRLHSHRRHHSRLRNRQHLRRKAKLHSPKANRALRTRLRHKVLFRLRVHRCKLRTD